MRGSAVNINLQRQFPPLGDGATLLPATMRFEGLASSQSCQVTNRMLAAGYVQAANKILPHFHFMNGSGF